MKQETYRVLAALERLGISYDDAQALRRISMALHRWNERECNGEIERDETTGKPFAVFWPECADGRAQRYLIPDRERGAQKRLAAIMARYPLLGAYEQGDPRGAALYIYERERLAGLPRAGAFAGMDISSCYSSIGVAVY